MTYWSTGSCQALWFSHWHPLTPTQTPKHVIANISLIHSFTDPSTHYGSVTDTPLTLTQTCYSKHLTHTQLYRPLHTLWFSYRHPLTPTQTPTHIVANISHIHTFTGPYMHCDSVTDTPLHPHTVIQLQTALHTHTNIQPYFKHRTHKSHRHTHTQR